MIDPPRTGVGGDEAIGQLGNGQRHAVSIPQSQTKRKPRWNSVVGQFEF
jgi:hypothetical protein